MPVTLRYKVVFVPPLSSSDTLSQQGRHLRGVVAPQGKIKKRKKEKKTMNNEITTYKEATGCESTGCESNRSCNFELWITSNYYI